MARGDGIERRSKSAVAGGKNAVIIAEAAGDLCETTAVSHTVLDERRSATQAAQEHQSKSLYGTA